MEWMLGSRRTRTGAERGAVAVEFALVFPLLLMLVFGIMQFGFVLAEQAGLSNGVRTGARYGSVNLYSGTRTCGEVITRARDQAATIGMARDDIAVTVKRGTTTICSVVAGAEESAGGSAPCDNASPAGTDTLYVEAEFDTTLSIPLTGIDRPLFLDSTGAYRCEYS